MILKHFASITGWDNSSTSPSLSPLCYICCQRDGHITDLCFLSFVFFFCTTPIRLLIHSCSTHISADQHRRTLNSCGRHLQGECEVEKYRWGFWSLLAVSSLTSLSIRKRGNLWQQIYLNAWRWFIWSRTWWKLFWSQENRAKPR